MFTCNFTHITAWLFNFAMASDKVYRAKINHLLLTLHGILKIVTCLQLGGKICIPVKVSVGASFGAFSLDSFPDHQGAY